MIDEIAEIRGAEVVEQDSFDQNLADSWARDLDAELTRTLGEGSRK